MYVCEEIFNWPSFIWNRNPTFKQEIHHLVGIFSVSSRLYTSKVDNSGWMLHHNHSEILSLHGNQSMTNDCFMMVLGPWIALHMIAHTSLCAHTKHVLFYCILYFILQSHDAGGTPFAFWDGMYTQFESNTNIYPYMQCESSSLSIAASQHWYPLLMFLYMLAEVNSHHVWAYYPNGGDFNQNLSLSI